MKFVAAPSGGGDTCEVERADEVGYTKVPESLICHREDGSSYLPVDCTDMLKDVLFRIAEEDWSRE